MSITHAMPATLDTGNAAAVRAQLVALLDQQPDGIRLDCSSLNKVDSTGLGVLLAFIATLHRECPNCELVFIAASPSLRRLLEIGRVSRLHPVSHEGDAA